DRAVVGGRVVQRSDRSCPVVRSGRGWDSVCPEGHRGTGRAVVGWRLVHRPGWSGPADGLVGRWHAVGAHGRRKRNKQPVDPYPRRWSAVQIGTVQSIAFDGAGNLWLLMQDGRLQTRDVGGVWHPIGDGRWTSSSTTNVVSIYFGGNGRLYAKTTSGLVWVYIQGTG